ncbi:hypothetical protein KC19_1G283300 [Ceratodon purpureus]|uniref:Cation-transporting P-type ATPase N-terminal domain-containing protein n=1 Tax=Ceratodon purpureus TaxID=3225 RepID=A0A8T0JDC7_CERPU|nr:hypothetical protein KC19_1G283300 [Ceratodon purpureus]
MARRIIFLAWRCLLLCERVVRSGAKKSFYRAKMKQWVAPVAYLVSSILITVVAVVGIAKLGAPESVPNLYVGLLVFGVLGTLLSIPPIEKVWRKQRRRKEEDRRGKDHKENLRTQLQPPPWSRSAGSLCQELGVRPNLGLKASEARDRLREYGANRIEVLAMPNYLSFFVKEIYEPTQLLLLCVGGLYVMFGSLEEGATAFAVIFLLVVAEVGTEWRAKRALAALKLSTPRDAVVKRDGQLQTIPAYDVVPGDIVQLSVGMEVPADVRILQSQFLEVDESKMTGESVSVPKDPFALHPEDAPLFELTNIATAGSLVTKGKGTGLVYQTGLATTLGQILARSQKTKDKKTKLQIGLKEAAWVLSMAALFASVVGALLGFLKHQRWQDILLSGLSLAFASIPEELPILIAAVLAVGSQTLSRKNVYVKYLRAAENLGFVDTVLTDKTGTLTQNKLVLHSMHFGECLVPANEITSRIEEGFDITGFEALLKAWVFMSEIGDQTKESKENDIAVVHALVEESELVVPQGEEAVDEIHLDVMPLTGVVELGRIEGSPIETPQNVAAGDVFDRAILGGFGVTFEQKMADSVPVLVAKDTPIEQHLQAVQDAKAVANLSDETPFCPTLKFASRTFSLLRERRADFEVHRVTYMKGAPELLLELSTYALQDGRYVLVENMRQQLEEQIWAAASAGLRLIGYARSVTHTSEDIANQARGDPSSATALEGTTFLGFMAFQDPVREGVAEAVERCRKAGVRIIMVTGDHLKTGLAVASASGILDSQGLEGREDVAGVSCADSLLQCMEEEEVQKLVLETSVFARATPNDKLIILETLQGSGKCVMATGDGFNDAPILAKADVGAAMGKGTDVAREAASIVFVDDNFAMVPYALAEGRRLLDNLRKALAFYLGAKTGLIMIFVIGTLWKSFPLSAIHIIVLELFMDLGASTSFVMEPADTDIMNRPPHSATKRFFDRELVGGILVSAVCMLLTVLSSFAYGIHHDPETAQTSAFVAWLLAHVLLAFNLRTIREPVYDKGFFSNPVMLVWLVTAFGLGATTAASGILRRHLKLVVLPLSQWLFIAGICVCGTFWVEAVKIILARRTRTDDNETLREEHVSLLAEP